MTPAAITALAVLLAGVGAVLQSSLLAIIGRRSGVLAATTLAAIVGLVTITIATLVTNRTLGGVAVAVRQSPWIWVPGGMLGIAVLAVLTFAPPRIGSFGTFAVLITGQLLASLVIDSVGLFGMDRVPISVTRVAGLLLLLGGGILVLRR
jgi:bacterial/archaeal transporter family-2 protein